MANKKQIVNVDVENFESKANDNKSDSKSICLSNRSGCSSKSGSKYRQCNTDFKK